MKKLLCAAMLLGALAGCKLLTDPQEDGGPSPLESGRVAFVEKAKDATSIGDLIAAAVVGGGAVLTGVIAKLKLGQPKPTPAPNPPNPT